MEEVDKIMVHALKQIGCNSSISCIDDFTSPVLYEYAAQCVRKINTDASAKLPSASLPAGMARFEAATSLAMQIASLGYRSEIGYQTFLYPNTVDTRRLLMFLVENLPKAAKDDSQPSNVALSAYDLLCLEVKDKMRQKIWLPQYARTGCSSQHKNFQPQLNLHLLDTTNAGHSAPEVQQYLQHAPSIFQQTAKQYDLISSVLAKHSWDLNDDQQRRQQNVQYNFKSEDEPTAKPYVTSTQDVMGMQRLSLKAENDMHDIEQVRRQYEQLKSVYDSLLAQRKQLHNQLQSLKLQEQQALTEFDGLQEEFKMHERVCLILENPAENLPKLKELIASAKEKRSVLEQKFEAHRAPLLEQLQQLEHSQKSQHLKTIQQLRDSIAEVQASLQAKNQQHSQLTQQLQKMQKHVIPRHEYIDRILDIIENIRKQRNDIDKILADTRNLQKIISNLMGQVHRQYSYTDDLLFQSAKHDLHAKKAYKLLASLHETCNQIIASVSDTSQITQEIRELEAEIERELSKNVASNLQQIQTDILAIDAQILKLKGTQQSQA